MSGQGMFGFRSTIQKPDKIVKLLNLQETKKFTEKKFVAKN